MLVYHYKLTQLPTSEFAWKAYKITAPYLAIIFIANLELGFLTPPVGMNLFLSAYRFNEPMPKIYKATLPFFLIKLLAVGLITYIPILTLGLFNF